MVILVWNGLSTLFLASIPVQAVANRVSTEVTFFSLPTGIATAAACFLIGVSNGGIYVMYPSILVDTLGDTLWPAGLGVYLLFNGAMNFVGTYVGGVFARLFYSPRAHALRPTALDLLW